MTSSRERFLSNFNYRQYIYVYISARRGSDDRSGLENDPPEERVDADPMGDLGNTVKDEQVCRIPLNGIPTQPVE